MHTFVIAHSKITLVYIVTESHTPWRKKIVQCWDVRSTRIRHPPLPKIRIIVVVKCVLNN